MNVWPSAEPEKSNVSPVQVSLSNLKEARCYGVLGVLWMKRAEARPGLESTIGGALGAVFGWAS